LPSGGVPDRVHAAGKRRKLESEELVDIYTIILLALAIFIFVNLRKVLGQRTGDERPPLERRSGTTQDNNVVTLPGRRMDQPPAVPEGEGESGDRWKNIAAPGSAVAAGLDAIVARDSAFDPGHFLSGARGAYEMIVLAFANGDRRALRDLLAGDVYDSFDAAIRDRENAGHHMDTHFVSIDKAELIAAELRERMVQLTVRFVSQMISLTRDKAGNVVDGNPDKVADITDIWTFARDITSRDPNWKLVGTGSAH